MYFLSSIKNTISKQLYHMFYCCSFTGFVLCKEVILVFGRWNRFLIVLSSESGWNAKSKFFSAYAKISSVHCIKYLIDRRETIERFTGLSDLSLIEIDQYICRIFWIFIMTLNLLLFLGLVFMSTSKFLDGKVIQKLSSEEKTIDRIPFPAVTVCSQFTLMKDHATRLMH